MIDLIYAHCAFATNLTLRPPKAIRRTARIIGILYPLGRTQQYFNSLLSACYLRRSTNATTPSAATTHLIVDVARTSAACADSSAIATRSICWVYVASGTGVGFDDSGPAGSVSCVASSALLSNELKLIRLC
jgi:hypothetical protein